jgi:putative sterol carrier protein
MCVYGGAVEHKDLDSSADYEMRATTQRWQEMGAGEYGPMKAMMFGRLGFEGPRWEAMKNMGPFASFLLLVGKVESDTSTCPQAAAAPAAPAAPAPAP